MLYLKQCNIVYPPYLNSQISDSSDSEEDVQYPQNLLKSKYNVFYMANNEQDAKVIHPAQFYANYHFSLKHCCVIAKLIFSIAPTQVENENNFSIAGAISQARLSIPTKKNLAILTFIKKRLQLHEQLYYEYLKIEDIDLIK